MILPLRDEPSKVSITRELGGDCLNQFPEAWLQQRGTVPKKNHTVIDYMNIQWKHSVQEQKIGVCKVQDKDRTMLIKE